MSRGKKEKIRIVVIHPEYTCRGGAERKSLIYAAKLNEHPSFSVEIICGNFNQNTTFQEYCSKNKFITFPYKNRIGKFFSLLQIGLATRKYDLIIANNHPIQFSALLGKILFRKKVVWFCNEPLLYLDETLKQNRIKLRFLRYLEHLLVPLFDKVIANSENTKAQIQNCLHVDAEIIYSGIDLKLYSI